MKSKLPVLQPASILIIKIVLPILIGLFSCFCLSEKVPDMGYFQDSLTYIEESREDLTQLAAASIGASLAVSALPGDFATPLADTLVDMDKYFVLVLLALFVERFLVVEGIWIAFRFIIPFACVLYLLSMVLHSGYFREFSIKLAILGFAFIMIVPVSTHITERVGTHYLDYIDETIQETDEDTDKINEVLDGTEDETLWSKLSDAIGGVVHEVEDMIDYFKNIIRKIMNSIVIFLMANLVMPLATLFVFKWLLGEVFQLDILRSGAPFGKGPHGPFDRGPHDPNGRGPHDPNGRGPHDPSGRGSHSLFGKGHSLFGRGSQDPDQSGTRGFSDVNAHTNDDALNSADPDNLV